MGGTDVRRIHPDDELVGHGIALQHHPPAVLVGGVHAGLDEEAADAPPDDLLLDELQGLVGLAVEPVGGEDQEDIDGLAGQGGPEPIQAGPAVLGAADGRVEADELARDEDAAVDGGLEQRPDLIDDRVLELRTVAGVDGADVLGLLRGERGVGIGGEPIDLAVVFGAELDALGLGGERGDPGFWCVFMMLSRAGTSLWGRAVRPGPMAGRPADLVSARWPVQAQ